MPIARQESREGFLHAKAQMPQAPAGFGSSFFASSHLAAFFANTDKWKPQLETFFAGYPLAERFQTKKLIESPSWLIALPSTAPLGFSHRHSNESIIYLMVIHCG